MLDNLSIVFLAREEEDVPSNTAWFRLHFVGGSSGLLGKRKAPDWNIDGRSLLHHAAGIIPLNALLNAALHEYPGALASGQREGMFRTVKGPSGCCRREGGGSRVRGATGERPCDVQRTCYVAL